jgi:hypothetical protein
MRNLTELTDDQIIEAFDDAGYGVDIEDVVFTAETLDHWVDSRKSYAEKGTLSKKTLGGFGAIAIEKAQAFRGERRKDIVVVDLGEVRASIIM